MKLDKAIEGLAADPVKLALGVGVVVLVVYLLGRQLVKDVGGAVGGVVSGNNALTQGTPYQGAGIAGTLGAGANAASGGTLQTVGEKIGGWLYDWFNEDANLAGNPKPRSFSADEQTWAYDRNAPIGGG